MFRSVHLVAETAAAVETLMKEWASLPSGKRCSTSSKNILNVPVFLQSRLNHTKTPLTKSYYNIAQNSTDATHFHFN